VTVLIKDYQGKYLNGPNDVWSRPNGGMYLTDPFLQTLVVGSRYDGAGRRKVF